MKEPPTHNYTASYIYIIIRSCRPSCLRSLLSRRRQRCHVADDAVSEHGRDGGSCTTAAAPVAAADASPGVATPLAHARREAKASSRSQASRHHMGLSLE